MLVEHSEVNLRAVTANGDDCLMIAIKAKRFDVVYYLLK